MRCLCCGKERRGTEKTDTDTGWHASCVHRFFGTNNIPELSLDAQMLKELALRSVNKGLTIPGVQKKLSLHLSKENGDRFTLVDYPAGFILKPQSEEFTGLPEAEAMSMRMAEAVGIRVVPYGLINIGGTYAYITKRIDRELSKNDDHAAKMFAMEDFCQLDGRLTRDKYRGSYERCAKLIMKYSTRPGLDMSEFFLRLVFCFVIGNSDMHLKNFSLIETKPGNRSFVLSPAYDLLPVNLILPDDKEECALTLRGKKRNLTRNDFLRFADACHIAIKAAEKMITAITDKSPLLISICDESEISSGMKADMKELIRRRARSLTFNGVSH